MRVFVICLCNFTAWIARHIWLASKKTGQLVWIYLSTVLILDVSGISATGKMATGWAAINFR